MKRLIIFFLCLTFGLFVGGALQTTNNASAWIGAGTGGSGGGGGGYGGGCSGSMYGYTLDCAGVSWAFYKAQGWTDDSTGLPYFNSNWNIEGISIPSECSHYEGGGFWHYGANLFGVNLGMYDFNSSVYGHWITMNANNTPEWAPYNISGVWGDRQWIGVYQMDHYGLWDEALSAYQDAYVYEHPGADRPGFIPSDVWGFCWGPYMKDQFEGLSQINDQNDGWASSDSKEKTVNITDCDQYQGCNATFNYQLRSVNGGGSTNYHIEMLENNLGISSLWLASGTESFSSRDSHSINTHNYTLRPGQYVCERLVFDHSPSIKNVSYKVCALALRQPSGGISQLTIGVRNDKLGQSAYSAYTYAKPGDDVTYQSTYSPNAQYPLSYNLYPQQMQVYRNNSISYCNGFGRIDNMLQNCGGGSWANGFRTSSNNFAYNSYGQNFTYPNGDTSTRTERNTHKVANNEVGQNLTETSETNSGGGVNTVPKSVGFENISSKNTAIVNIDPLSSTAETLVPYNFITSTTVKTNEESATLYAGESETIEYTYEINPKFNSLTTNANEGSREYATTVGNPQWRLKLCIGQTACDQNNYSEQTAIYNGGLNDFVVPTEKMYKGRVGDDAIQRKTTITVPDVPAGTRVCIKSSVFPHTSGGDSNWQNKNGDGSWEDSTPQCFTIAKRPSLQVWGGNVYSAGGINTATSIKHTLSGYTGYSLDQSQGNYVFGSWGELGVSSSSSIKGFASGASLGYATNNAGILVPNPLNGTNNNNPKAASYGGGDKTSMCSLSPLTFANSPCTNAVVGSIGNTISTNSTKDDKKAILDKFVKEDGDGSRVTGSPVQLNDGNYKTDNGNYYFYNGGDLSVGATSNNPTTITGNGIRAVHAKGNITIQGNLVYEDAYYNSFNNAPKLVIYAEGNIYINCSVARVDAILIANTVTTCANNDGSMPNVDDRARSNQLIINGAVIADKLIPNRTYGAATGANSIVPAEIINFDPSLYLWAGGNTTTSNGKNTNLDITYTKEVAPRE